MISDTVEPPFFSHTSNDLSSIEAERRKAYFASSGLYEIQNANRFPALVEVDPRDAARSVSRASSTVWNRD